MMSGQKVVIPFCVWKRKHWRILTGSSTNSLSLPTVANRYANVLHADSWEPLGNVSVPTALIGDSCANGVGLTIGGLMAFYWTVPSVPLPRSLNTGICPYGLAGKTCLWLLMKKKKSTKAWRWSLKELELMESCALKTTRNQQMGLKHPRPNRLPACQDGSGMWSWWCWFLLWWTKPNFHGINLHADKGQKWPLSERQQWKTTITNLINRLWHPIRNDTYDRYKLIEKKTSRRSSESFFKIPTYSLVRLRKTSLWSCLNTGKKILVRCRSGAMKT